MRNGLKQLMMALAVVISVEESVQVACPPPPHPKPKRQANGNYSYTEPTSLVTTSGSGSFWTTTCGAAFVPSACYKTLIRKERWTNPPEKGGDFIERIEAEK